MPIRYCAIGVSRNGQQQVVVTAGNGSGNVAQVVEDLVSRVSLATDDRKSYTADQYVRWNLLVPIFASNR